MSGLDSVFGIIGIVGGLYCFYAYYTMKQTGVINKTFMSKDMENQQCKDTKAYIKEAGPVILILGIGALLYGAAELVNLYLYPLGMGQMIAIALFFVLIIWVAFKLNALRKKYF